MNKEHLLQTAQGLVQPSTKTAAEYEELREGLAAEHNDRMGQRKDLDKLIGSDNRDMMEDNSRNFCRFMGSLYENYEPEVLVETVLWVFRAYRNHGFTTAYWPAHLDTFVELAKEQLSEPAFKEIYPFMNWLITNIPIFVAITDQQMGEPLKEEPSHG